MSVFELIEGYLQELEIPFYEGQPEFARSPPETFLVYDLYDVPGLRGIGVELITRYHITLNVYTTGTKYRQKNDEICMKLTALLTENGFVRESGSYISMNDFPKYYHRAIEFIYDYELFE